MPGTRTAPPPKGAVGSMATYFCLLLELRKARRQAAKAPYPSHHIMLQQTRSQQETEEPPESQQQPSNRNRRGPLHLVAAHARRSPRRAPAATTSPAVRRGGRDLVPFPLWLLRCWELRQTETRAESWLLAGGVQVWCGSKVWLLLASGRTLT